MFIIRKVLKLAFGEYLLIIKDITKRIEMIIGLILNIMSLSQIEIQ